MKIKIAHIFASITISLLPIILFADSSHPIDKAIEKGDLSKLKKLINSSNLNGFKMKPGDNRLYAPIGLACMNSQHKIAKWLLKKGANPNGGTYYDTALWWVVFMRGKYLIQPETLDKIDKSSPGYKARIMKSQNKSLFMAKALLDKGAKVNYNISKFNGSPLMTAASYKDIEMIKLLRKYGADPKVVLHKKHGNAADYAERAGHIELANMLRGKNSAAYRNSLIYAVKKNNITRVKKIISSVPNKRILRAVLDYKERKSKNTALHYAAQNGNLFIVKYLVEKGANINMQSLGSFTPLHTAAARDRTNVAIYLVKKSAQINIIQSSGCATGYTAFYWALENDNYELAKLMLKKGAIIDAGGYNALGIVTDFKIAKLMIDKYNARPNKTVFKIFKSKLKAYRKSKGSYLYTQLEKIYAYIQKYKTNRDDPTVMSSFKRIKQNPNKLQPFEPFDINDKNKKLIK